MKPRFSLLSVSIFAVLVCSSPAIAQGVIEPCGIASTSRACIFDIEAVAGGNLVVDTRASIAGQRWRVAVALVGAKATKGGLGSGSTLNFSGAVTRKLAAGKRYEVVIVYEQPIPSTFPTTVEVRFTGPVLVSPRQSFSPLPGRYVGFYRVPLSTFHEAFSLEPSSDGSYIARIFGGVNCTDGRFPFSVDLPPAVLPIGGDGTFSGTGIAIAVGTELDVDGVIFNADSADQNSEQALGGATFLRGSGACPYRWWATADPDADRDGWNDRAEQRLGSDPADRLSVPEHVEVPRTPFYGPVHCEDGVDNDLDGLVDGDDPSCVAPAP
jgi:hypothetical protein